MKKSFGVICCELLEDELTYLLNQDEDINKALILETDGVNEIERKLEIDIEWIKPEELPVKPEEGTVLIVMLSMGLHENPDTLRRKVKKWIEKASETVEDVLLFYGLCGNALNNLEELYGDVDANIDILRDSTGTVDDCISLALGGTDKYIEFIKKESGVFFLTPMWADNWREMLLKCNIIRDLDQIDMAKIVLDHAGYQYVVKIDTSLRDNNGFHEQVEEFSETFDLDIMETETPECQELLKNNYRRFKNS
ncbi:DUF1638 domain-containing protein [Methanonatronarchaeum sp. AMET6-2]|uniref:DUF1638 domain-containing protein n=1 Tax=Methanonatronarchaeum sp. AMET6-2 TaxID=2933293 RepID=UPI00120AF81F|nr:DUF1638 domain-containing protein [Methanonatronarchaeum sp. AMET6-2]RZN61141.1 MAG: DUF1638 domain-containing protein [Methanonatronarchaeia archaeon]UOY09801.1 DUF1638 domain-containing protein [Methanonatronarchaeum sp. AMET6-2]